MSLSAAAEFLAWWRPLDQARARAEDPQVAARAIREELRALPARKRRRFLEPLTRELVGKRKEFGVALFLMEGIEDPAYLRTLAEHLDPLPEPQAAPDAEAHLADLVRLLAAGGDARGRALVRAYLLERPIGPAWETVPWALWPAERALFAEAWTRYFTEVEPRRWKGGDTVRSFLAEPEAVEAVREAMRAAGANRRWGVLRRDLARESENAPWLAPDETTRLAGLLR